MNEKSQDGMKERMKKGTNEEMYEWEKEEIIYKWRKEKRYDGIEDWRKKEERKKINVRINAERMEKRQDLKKEYLKKWR